jgi:valyl-tRNA synthetase
MKSSSLIESALVAVKNGDIKIRPKSTLARFEQDLANNDDWCISRQVWWGHQPPAYRIVFEEANGTANTIEEEFWVVARTEDDARQQASEQFPNRNFSLARDNDVLDPW